MARDATATQRAGTSGGTTASPTRRRRAVALIGALLAWASIAHAADPLRDAPSAPILRLETGMHTGVVNRVAVDAAGTLVATSSDDKTVRLWRLPDGEAAGVLRPPIGPGDEGTLYAVALSPDGKRLIAGGFTGASWDGAVSLYLFDVADQRMIGRLPDLPEVVNHLAYAPDGKRFAAAFGGRAGVKVWNAEDGKLVGEDRAYGDRATWVAFDAAGRMATASFDGEIRLYGADLKLARKTKAPAGRPFSVAFSPDGGILAVGYADRARVDLLSTDDLALVFTPAAAGIKAGAFSAVAWEAEASSIHLLAAGTARDASDRMIVRRWRDFGLGGYVDTPVARDSIGHIAPVRGRGSAFASADPAWGIVDRAGRLAVERRGDTIDFRSVAERRLAIARDGTTVEFGAGSQTLRFDLRGRRLAAVARPDLALVGPAVSLPPAAEWRNQKAPKIAGRVVRLEAEEIARSLAATPDGKRFLLGTDYNLRLLDAAGAELARVAVPAAAWGVAVAGNGALAAAFLGDGTIRWYGLGAGALLAERLAVFPHADGRRWVAWTPEGFFDHADQGGKEFVGYQLNRGKARAPDWISFAQVYRLLYSQELVVAALTDGGAAQRARLAELGDLRRRLEGLALPEIEIVAWCAGETGADCRPVARSGGDAVRGVEATVPAGTERVRVQFRVTDRGSGLGQFDVYQNGRNVGHYDDARAFRPVTDRVPAGTSVLVGERVIALEPGPNRIEIRAYNGDNQAYALSRSLSLATPTQPTVSAARSDGATRHRLFALAVGINKYPEPLVSLDLARADAATFVATLKKQAASLFREVKTYELYDEAATPAAIDAAFREIAAAAGVEDTVLVYLAGHGETFDGEYYFITQGIDMAGARTLPDVQARVRAKALNGRTLVARLGDIRARNGFVFLDTCHSGALKLDTAASRINDESGRYVLTAAASVEAALDSYDGKNGLFAYAVTEALNGKARRGGDPEVNNFDLGFYVVQRVDQLALEKKHQQSARFKIATQEARLFPMSRPQ